MLDNSPFPVIKPTFAMDLSRMAPLSLPTIRYCVWHHIGAATHTDSTAAGANRYHIDTNKWAGIGYHGVIRWDGRLELGRPLDRRGVHTANHNHESIGFCLAGNFEIGDVQPEQYKSAVALAKAVSREYPGIRHVRHSDLRPTACPGRRFPWAQFLSDIEKDDNMIPIVGQTQSNVGQMQEWARKRNAHQRFIDIAPTYIKYAQLIGIRAEVLYAQSAKETAFGRYGGAVTPDQNNWAGVKTRTASGDRREDHESFSSPDDGVRGHFNHMTAYVGLPPVGLPHERRALVLTIAWAGSVRYVEELSGKWAPARNYGQSVVKDYLEPLLATTAPAEPAPPADGRIAELEKENEELRGKLAVALTDINNKQKDFVTIAKLANKHK